MSLDWHGWNTAFFIKHTSAQAMTCPESRKMCVLWHKKCVLWRKKCDGYIKSQNFHAKVFKNKEKNMISRQENFITPRKYLGKCRNVALHTKTLRSDITNVFCSVATWVYTFFIDSNAYTTWHSTRNTLSIHTATNKIHHKGNVWNPKYLNII